MVFLVSLSEPLIDVSNLELYRGKLRFHKAFANSEGRIWVFFDENFDVNLIAQSSKFLAFKIVSSQLGCPFIGVFVHALCGQLVHQELWRDISN